MIILKDVTTSNVGEIHLARFKLSLIRVIQSIELILPAIIWTTVSGYSLLSVSVVLGLYFIKWPEIQL